MIKKFFIFTLILIIITFSSSSIFADELNANYNPDTIEIRSGDTTMQVLSINANDTTGLHSIMLRLIGDYNPIVKDYTYTGNNGYTTHSIEIQPDWSWIMSCAMFILVIYCFFRILGGLIHG